jgi:predicted SprT family Zn-dependent metalloprotease
VSYLFPPTAEERRASLEQALGVPVRVRYGRSGTQPVVARGPTATELAREPRLAGGRVLVLHERFAGADPEVWEDLAKWLRSGRRARSACHRLDTWLDRLRSDPAQSAPPSTHPGDHHDLARITQQVMMTHLAEEFSERRTPAVHWATRKRSTARRGLRLGSYDSSRDLVRIHPVLDQPAVPEWVVAFVVFHELLHALIPSQRIGRRLMHHGASFRAKERSHPDHARATQWEDAHIHALIRSARKGKPMRRPLL